MNVMDIPIDIGDSVGGPVTLREIVEQWICEYCAPPPGVDIEEIVEKFLMDHTNG